MSRERISQAGLNEHLLGTKLEELNRLDDDQVELCFTGGRLLVSQAWLEAEGEIMAARLENLSRLEGQTLSSVREAMALGEHAVILEFEDGKTRLILLHAQLVLGGTWSNDGE